MNDETLSVSHNSIAQMRRPSTTDAVIFWVNKKNKTKYEIRRLHIQINISKIKRYHFVNDEVFIRFIFPFNFN